MSTNDNFARAIPIVLAADGDTYISPDLNATTFTLQAGEPIGVYNPPLGKTAWWVYIPQSHGEVIVDTSNGGTSTTNTELAMFETDTGAYADLLLPSPDFADSGFFGDPWSQIDIVVNAGVTYYIRVGSDDANPHYVLTLTGRASVAPTTTSADTLLLWDPTLEQALDTDALNWGSVIRRSSADTAFRVYNASDTLTATDILVTLADTGTTATPSVAAQHLLSQDGITFTADLNIGDLPPLATSPQLILRRVTASTAQLGAFSFQIAATASTWE